MDGKLSWRPSVEQSLDSSTDRSLEPFDPEGGLRLLTGNLGRGVVKISSVALQHRQVRAQAVVIDDQHALQQKFDAGGNVTRLRGRGQVSGAPGQRYP